MAPSQSQHQRLYAHAAGFGHPIRSASGTEHSTKLSATPSASCSIQAITHHDQRPRLEHNRVQWSAPGRTFLPAPRVLEAARVAATVGLAFALKTEGLHYNRPPPLGSPS
jgi:hypothetical protein